MKRVTYTDGDGRMTWVLIPEWAPDGDAHMGIVLGPPSLAELNLPLEIDVALHNQLYYRGIITARDAQTKRQEITAAIISACKVDSGRILNLYLGLTADGVAPNEDGNLYSRSG